MKLPRFLWNYERNLREALLDNDTHALSARLSPLVMSWPECRKVFCTLAHYQNISRETAQLLVTEFSSAAYRGDPDIGAEACADILRTALCGALAYGRFEAVPAFLKAPIGLKDTDLTALLLSSSMPHGLKFANLYKLCRTPGVMTDPAGVARVAIDHDFSICMTLLAQAGIDLHARDEELLRYAAEHGRKNCAAALAAHGADMTRAVSLTRFSGSPAALEILTTLQAEMADKNIKTAPTMESLSREVDALRNTVRQMQENINDLTAVITDLRGGEIRLDKPALRRPPPPPALS